MKLFYNIESWVKIHWILLIVFLIILIILFFSLFWIVKWNRKRKVNKNIKKIWKNKRSINNNLINLEELKIHFYQIEIKKNNSNKKIAWCALVEILTRVVINKYDQDYGNPKEALNSLFVFYKELREEVKKYHSAFKSNIVVIALINNEIRPFLTKWNFKINQEHKESSQEEYIKEFIKDYNKMFDSIRESKYIENLLLILGFNIKIDSFTIPNGVENINNNKKQNQ